MILTSIIFGIETILLLIMSRLTINATFSFFRRFINDEKKIFYLFTIIFLPGTLLHEISHMIIAMAMFLKIHSITIIPKREQTYIKLGSVLYEKTDIIRSVIVGIAPFFGAILFFWLINLFKLFPSKSVWLNIMMIYLIFVISTTMFSSPKDLQDLIYLIPIFFLLACAVYLFNLNALGLIINILSTISDFLKTINYYMFVALLSHFILIAFFKSFNYIYR